MSSRADTIHRSIYHGEMGDEARVALNALLAEVDLLRRELAEWKAEVADQDELLIRYEAENERLRKLEETSQESLRACSESYGLLQRENEQLRAALERIATERRPDGTYNLSREACEQIAREAVRAVGE